MLKISHSPQATSFQAKKIPEKTITIVHKNGRDVIKDEFIGSYVQRPNFYEILKGLLEDLLKFLPSSQK